jgi:hypothetical protein
MIAIYPIVEGHGEVHAVPVLFRRIAFEICRRYDVQVLRPHRVPRGRMVAQDAIELHHAVALGALKISQTGEPGVIFVLIDADDDCPAELGARLLREISRPNLATGVVVAKREYEAWFLAGAQSLRGHPNVSDTAVTPADPEAIRGAKQHLERHVLVRGAAYQETVDQPALTAVFGLEEARAAPSFDKLCRDLCRLLLMVPANQ